MEYKNTLIDFRQFVESNYPNKNWFDVIQMLYFLYDNMVVRMSQMDAELEVHKISDENEAIDCIEIYLKFYNSFSNKKYYSYFEAKNQMETYLLNCSEEEKEEFKSHYLELYDCKIGCHLYSYITDSRDDCKYHVCTFADKTHIYTSPLNIFLNELFGSDRDSDTGLFLASIK